jgi:hypothetical protein
VVAPQQVTCSFLCCKDMDMNSKLTRQLGTRAAASSVTVVLSARWRKADLYFSGGVSPPVCRAVTTGWCRDECYSVCGLWLLGCMCRCI